MDLKLRDKVVVITGGAGSVGRSLTKAFLEEGAIVVSLDKEKGHQSRKKDKRFCFIEADIKKPASIDKAFDAIIKRFAKIDVLINNAGIFSSTPILDITSSSWDGIMETNLRSVLLCSQKAAKVMIKRKYGKIINIASLGGQIGGIYAGADYSASKAGIICLTKSLAKNFGKYGIKQLNISGKSVSFESSLALKVAIKRSRIKRLPQNSSIEIVLDKA